MSYNPLNRKRFKIVMIFDMDTDVREQMCKYTLSIFDVFTSHSWWEVNKFRGNLAMSINIAKCMSTGPAIPFLEIYPTGILSTYKKWIFAAFFSTWRFFLQLSIFCCFLQK